MTIEQFLAGEKLTYRGDDGNSYVAKWHRQPDAVCGLPYIVIDVPAGEPRWFLMGESGARSFFEINQPDLDPQDRWIGWPEPPSGSRS